MQSNVEMLVGVARTNSILVVAMTNQAFNITVTIS